ENIDNKTLGGATSHCEISGVTGYKAKNDKDALDRITTLMKSVTTYDKSDFDRIESFTPKQKIADIFRHMPASRADQYDTYNIIKCLVDNSEFDEYKPDYGKTIICATARIDGWSVGIVANQRKLVKSGKGEMQFGGVIYSDSADKATRFI